MVISINCGLLQEIFTVKYMFFELHGKNWRLCNLARTYALSIINNFIRISLVRAHVNEICLYIHLIRPMGGNRENHTNTYDALQPQDNRV